MDTSETTFTISVAESTVGQDGKEVAMKRKEYVHNLSILAKCLQNLSLCFSYSLAMSLQSTVPMCIRCRKCCAFDTCGWRVQLELSISIYSSIPSVWSEWTTVYSLLPTQLFVYSSRKEDHRARRRLYSNSHLRVSNAESKLREF